MVGRMWGARGPRLRVWTFVIRRGRVAFQAFVLTVVIGCALVLTQADTVVRLVYGVRQNVTLEGRDISGLLEDEVARLVRDMACERNKPPRNAMLYGETGEIIPEENGVEVDVPATVRVAMQAAPGEKLRLITQTIVPAVSGQYYEAVYRGNPDKRAIAFSFNVAWGEEYIPNLLRILRENNVRSTFFFDGDWVKLFPDLTKEIADQGHEVANHGLRHVHVADLPPDELRELILKNEELIKGITGKKTSLFAPPYGECNRTIVATAAQLGYRTIMWTVDTIDWKKPDPGLIVSRVKRKAQNGAIVLMHPTEPTVEVLPELIRTLRSEGYDLVTVGEVL